ncbi:hypothetical protein B0H13DRAFT_2669664 [Mycena leptocephala]|nr:hypothetical protein B0H13DRAFT_2669664 [Mycena leptocephala]
MADSATLRSGKEFSAFDIVIGRAASLSTPEYFDVANCLAKKIQEQEAAYYKEKLRRKRKREEALGATIQVGVDIDALPHSEPAWIGKRNAQDNHTFEDSMGGRIYSEKEILYIFLCPFPFHPFLTLLLSLTIPITDSFGRIIAILGGTPHDTEGWRAITDRAANLMEAKATRLSHSEEELHRHHAQEPYSPISRGPSYGGGQTEPSELQNNKVNARVMNELLADKSFWHLIRFTNVIFRIFAHIFELTTTKEEKSEQAEEAKTWWQEGVAMKVIKNHGINAYMDDYVPLLNEFNSYRLVKVKFKLSKDEKEAENGSGEDEGEE